MTKEGNKVTNIKIENENLSEHMKLMKHKISLLRKKMKIFCILTATFFLRFLKSFKNSAIPGESEWKRKTIICNLSFPGICRTLIKTLLCGLRNLLWGNTKSTVEFFILIVLLNEQE